MASLRYTKLRFSRTSGNVELILVGVATRYAWVYTCVCLSNNSSKQT